MPADLTSSAPETTTESSGPQLNSGAEPWASWRSGALCGLLVVAMILACRPGEEMGFSDDWSIGRTAAIFAQTGHFAYNGWEAPTEGWLILWAAPFIRTFGFSYLVLRLSFLPIVFVTVVLFHQSLLRFGFTERNASFGTLTLAVSPIFLPVASGFMTDIPSLLVTVLCLFLCQKAVARKQDRSAVLWLAAAAFTNLAGGTVRQTAFLGILLMIPGVGWWQRRRRGVLPATAIFTVIGCAWIFLFLQWYRAQPYSMPETFLSVSLTTPALKDHLWRLFASARFLLLALSPAIACNFPAVLRLPRAIFWGLFACFSVFVLLTSQTWEGSQLGDALAYFRIPISVAFAVALLGSALLFTVLRKRSAHHLDEHKTASSQPQAQSWRYIFWLLGPFSLGYFVLLLLPADSTFVIWDRYLLGLVPLAIVCLLKTYQDRARGGIPKIAILFLVLLGCVGFAKTYRVHAEHRAIVKAADMLRAANVPRTEITAGIEYDGETQLDAVGHMNDPGPPEPPGAHRPYVPPPWLPSGFDDLSSTPAVVPRYFIVDEPDPDLVPANFPPVEYTAPIPPFHRFIYIQELPDR